jgi:hypothetical protein
MKLKCTCGNTITTGLYPTKKWGFDRDGYHDGQHFVTKGSFLRFKTWADDRIFAVNPENIVSCRVPEFQQGWGCCDNWGIPFYCGQCDKDLGWQMLDCHCDIHMQIIEKRVIRSYK